MRGRRRDSLTGDLLAWRLEDPVVSYAGAPQAQAASLHGRFCQTMALTVESCGKSRADIAAEMAEYLGEDFSKATLDAYLAESKTSHVIQLHRFAALIHATGDMRLLSLLPEMFGHVVISEKHAGLLAIALLKEKRDQIDEALALQMRKEQRP